MAAPTAAPINAVITRAAAPALSRRSRARNNWVVGAERGMVVSLVEHVTLASLMTPFKEHG